MDGQEGRGEIWRPHHVLFQAEAWSSNENAQALREKSELIIPMLNAPHDELHSKIPFVPLLDSIQAYYVKKEFYSRSSPLRNIDELIKCIGFSIRHFEGEKPRRKGTEVELNNRLRIEVGNLAIIAIEAQIPNISDGLFKVKAGKKMSSNRVKVDRRRGGQIC